MERLQWWLLLLSAVMFSMSGCARFGDWQIWSQHPAHFASKDHLAFSVKSHETASSITEADQEVAARQEWWGRLVPEDKVVPQQVAAADVMDLTGRWTGTWTALGPFGDVRAAEARIDFVQQGATGHARLTLTNTVAAVGVPEIVRFHGSWGTPVLYRVSSGEVVARYDNGPALTMRFRRVGDRLYGRADSSTSLVLVLDREGPPAPVVKTAAQQD